MPSWEEIDAKRAKGEELSDEQKEWLKQGHPREEVAADEPEEKS